MVKAIICGGRDYRNRERVFKILDAAVERLGVDAIVQGGQISTDPETGAKFGADWLAKSWAIQRALQCETFYADWTGLGRAAGPIRNGKMLGSGAELCIAFPGSAGTENMVAQATEKGLRVIKVDWP